MSKLKTLTLTLLAMIAFAGNSLLCRLALKSTAIDAASFTTVRMLSASVVLGLLIGFKPSVYRTHGNWPSALALFAYAAGFSFAYIQLSTGTGALLLFGAVQATMIGVGIYKGERLAGLRLLGFLLAIAGLIILLLPGLSAPPFLSAVSMVGAGIAWGVYSLRGKGVGSLLMFQHVSWDAAGIVYAVLSGALTSGLGYAIWYQVLPALKSTTAATVQLSVPVIAAAGGVLLLGEPLGWRLLVASAAILVGIMLVIHQRKSAV
jgi:drug/metabolite transporter (DMT)-like permease